MPFRHASSNSYMVQGFLQQAHLPSLLSTGWFQEQIWVSFNKQNCFYHNDSECPINFLFPCIILYTEMKKSFLKYKQHPFIVWHQNQNNEQVEDAQITVCNNFTISTSFLLDNLMFQNAGMCMLCFVLIEWY